MHTDQDIEMRMKATEFAKKTIDDIIESSQKPTKSVTGEALKIFQEIEEWGILEQFPLTDHKNRTFYVYMIAMQKYRQLKLAKENESKPKKSKWEVVMGRANPASAAQARKTFDKNGK